MPPPNPSGPPDPSRYTRLHSKRAWDILLDTPAGQQELIACVAGQAEQFDLAELPYLLRIIDEGKLARQALVLHHIPLLMFATRALNQQTDKRWNQGLRERLSAGYKGLLRAIDGHDPDVGVAFTTYAIRCIDSAIRRHYELADCQRLGFTRWQRATQNKILGAQEQLRKELGSEPTTAEICQKIHGQVSRKRVAAIQQYLAPAEPLALNQTSISVVNTVNRRPKRGHDIKDANLSSRPETQQEESDSIALLERIAEVANLSPEQKYVIVGSFRQGKRNEVYADIAAELGVTTKRVKVIRESARDKLARSKPAMEMLATFLSD